MRGFALKLRAVQTERFAEFGLMAAWYNATIREPAVIEYSTFQLLWPDAKGCFPDEGKSPSTSTQPLL